MRRIRKANAELDEGRSATLTKGQALALAPDDYAVNMALVKAAWQQKRPAIVDAEVFRRVQDRLRRPTRTHRVGAKFPGTSR